MIMQISMYNIINCFLQLKLFMNNCTISKTISKRNAYGYTRVAV